MRFHRELAVTIAGEIPGQTWASELRWLYDAVVQSKRHLEIGTYAGRSMFIASHGMVRGELVTVDARYPNHRGIPDRYLKEVTRVVATHCNPDVSVHCVEQASMSASQSVTGGFDSIFIDADHEYDNVKTDIELWLPRVNSGGIICGHDYWPNHWGVMQAVNELLDGRHETVPDTRIWYYIVP